MTAQTALDTAHSAMSAAPDDEHLRSAFYQTFADCDLFILLESESTNDSIAPRVLTVDGDDYILAFDQEERLAEFASDTAFHAVLNGRAMASMLAGQGIGIGLNLGVAPSSFLMPASAIDWVNSALTHTPQQLEDQPTGISAPHALSDGFLRALEGKLTRAGGLTEQAFLAAFTYATASQNTLVFINAVPDAQGALAKAVNEAVVFSGQADSALDVVFLDGDHPVLPQLAKVGLRIDLPAPEKPEPRSPTAPGTDPNNPPILR